METPNTEMQNLPKTEIQPLAVIGPNGEVVWNEGVKHPLEAGTELFGGIRIHHEAMEDLRTHRSAWRAFIEQALASVDHDLPEDSGDEMDFGEKQEADRSYIRHELRAFDRTFKVLTESRIAEKSGLESLCQLAHAHLIIEGRTEDEADVEVNLLRALVYAQA